MVYLTIADSICLSPSVYMFISHCLSYIDLKKWSNSLKANFFENWYYPMPEEGFSFFEIQTPLKNLTLHKPKGPPESCKF